MTSTEELTTAQAAQALGVDRSTVRRYADAQLIKLRRTAGGHRRYDAASVADLARRTNLHP